MGEQEYGDKHPDAGRGPHYRPDIDGLRAVAVLVVILYHAFPKHLTGGFIGVDVFFVISGYLISSIIFGRLEAGTYTLRDFYARRIRRILPALCVVVLVVLAFGYFVLVNDEYQTLGKHAASAALFISNFTLYLESGYFDLSAETKPLLHLWSLAVEEQFYVVWPLLVALFWRRRWAIAPLIGVLGVASFGTNLILSRTDPSAAFFWPLSRFWELMAGGALAYGMRTGTPAGQLRHAQGFIGLGLIAAGSLTFTGRMAYPGWAALLPVVGTMLVIAAGRDAWPNRRLLTLKPVVYVGLISYPLYLWHWPLLSYAYILEDGTPHFTTRLWLLGASAVLAWLTYLWVERPIRFGGLQYKEELLAGGLAFLSLFGLTAYVAPGAMNRDAFAPAIVNSGDIGQEEFYTAVQAKYLPCEPRELYAATARFRDVVRCFQTKPGAPTVALIGDSHAEHLLFGLAEANPGDNVAYYLRSGPPTVANGRAQDAMRHVLQSRKIQKVVLAWWWRGEKLWLGPQELNDTVRALRAAGKQVYVVEDGPWFPFYPQRCKYTRAAFREENRCEEAASAALANQEHYDAVLAAGEQAGAQIIRQVDLFCSGSACSMARAGTLLFRDRHHLNINGSRLVGSRLMLSVLDR